MSRSVIFRLFAHKHTKRGQAKCEEELSGLHNHLLTLDHLRDRYVSYQTAFNKLILELARRRQYREAAENIVHGMMVQLEAMSEGMVTFSLHAFWSLRHIFSQNRGEPGTHSLQRRVWGASPGRYLSLYRELPDEMGSHALERGRIGVSPCY